MRYSDFAVLNFTKIVKENNGFKRYGAKKLLAAYIKFFPSMLFAPLERLLFNKKLKGNKLNQSPLYVLGHWRSGTSFTQFVLSQDPQITTPTKYETLFSDNFLVTESLLKPLAVKFIKSFNAYDAWKKNISVSMDLDSPSEVDTGLVNEGSSYTYHWGHLFPRSWNHYFERYALMDSLTEQEWNNWAQEMTSLYHKVQFKNPHKRLLIKNPPDTGRVKHLLKLYPNAKFIFIYRNPYQVFYSNVKLWNNISNMLSMEEVSAEEIQEIILETYCKLHEAYLAQKHLIPEGNLIEIQYEDLRDQPMKLLEEVYQKLGMDHFEQARPHLENYLEQNLKSNTMSYDYDQEVVMLINERWDFAFKTWGYDKLELELASNS